MSTFIRFHRFWNLNNIKNIVYFDVPKHCIKKMFQEHNINFFPSTFWSRTQIWNKIWKFSWEFFLKVIWKSFKKKIIRQLVE
jgi:hypothetical protein